MYRRAALLPAGACAAWRAAYSAAGNVGSALRKLDVARCLPAGGSGAVLSHRDRERRGGTANCSGEGGLRSLRRPHQLPVVRSPSHARGHLGRNDLGRAPQDTGSFRPPGQVCGAAGRTGQDSAVSLPAGQQRALDRIEKTLADDHPGLGPLFAIFTRLTGQEAMPLTERVTARPRLRRHRHRHRHRRRQMWPAVATVVGLALATGALLALSQILSGPQVCPGTGTLAAAHTRSVSTARQPACAPQQTKPSTISPAE
jgi:hypothetical protein